VVAGHRELGVAEALLGDLEISRSALDRRLGIEALVDVRALPAKAGGLLGRLRIRNPLR
jgi:hypothetical protein